MMVRECSEGDGKSDSGVREESGEWLDGQQEMGSMNPGQVGWHVLCVQQKEGE